MCNQEMKLSDIMDELRRPFHPSEVEWKPGAVKGERALALAYANLRAYMNRLDEVCGAEWSVEYEPWGEDRIICKLTICGVTRSSTGETNKESERSEIGGTVGEAQSFKRACVMFGLSRYLYQLPSGWADYDPATKKFTEKAKAKLTGILVQHYRRATDPKREGLDDLYAETPQDVPQPAQGKQATPTPQGPQEAAVQARDDAGEGGADGDELDRLHKRFHALGVDLFGDQWNTVRAKNAMRVSNGRTDSSKELTADEIQALVTGMVKVKAQRKAA